MHRYGRHGPRAWLRQHTWHAIRNITLHPTIQLAPTVVRYSSSLVGIERIIVIIMAQPYDVDEDLAQPTINTDESIAIPRYAFTSQDHPDSEIIQERAEIAGMRQASREIQTNGADNFDALTEDRLNIMSRDAGIGYISEQYSTQGRRVGDKEKVIKIYTDAYVRGYREEVKHRQNKDLLPDDIAKALRKAALSDRQFEYPPDQIPYVTAIRVLECLGLNDASRYLQQLDNIVYRGQQYQNYYFQKEVSVPDRNTFR